MILIGRQVKVMLDLPTGGGDRALVFNKHILFIFILLKRMEKDAKRRRTELEHGVLIIF